MNFGIRNELHAYNEAQRRADRSERADTIVGVCCGIGLVVMLVLLAAGKVAA